MARNHASLCRAKLTGSKEDCECDASDATRAKLMTPGEMTNRIDQLATEPVRPRTRRQLADVAARRVTTSMDQAAPPRTQARRVLVAYDGDGNVVPLGESPPIDPPPIEPGPGPMCRRCSDCVGQEHHWIENPDFEEGGDPDFACKHCSALCMANEDDEDSDGTMVPSGLVVGVQQREVDSPTRRRLLLTGEQREALMASWRQIVGGPVDADEAAVGYESYFTEDPQAIDKRYLDHIGSIVSDRCGALVSVERALDYAIDNPKDRPIRIQQVCSACREAYVVTASDQPTELEAYAIIGTTARRARLMHKCPEIAAQLAVLSFDDLQKLHEDLERTGEGALARAAAVKTFADLRRTRETE